jgi:hypothetical protein
MTAGRAVVYKSGQWQRERHEAHHQRLLRLIGQASACSRSSQTAPNYGYLFDVSADRKRIVRCANISAMGADSDNTEGDVERFEKMQGKQLRSS